MRGILLFNLSSYVGLDFMQRSVAKNQNLLTKASSIHTAVGAAHGTGRDLVQPPVYFVDVVQQASLHLPISVQKHMLGIWIHPIFIIVTQLGWIFLPQGRCTSGPSGKLWVMWYAATYCGHDVHCLRPSGLRGPTIEGTKCRWIDIQEP